MNQTITIDINGTSTVIEIELDDALVPELMEHIEAVIRVWAEGDDYVPAPIKYREPDPKLVEEYLKNIRAGRSPFDFGDYQSDQRQFPLPKEEIQLDQASPHHDLKVEGTQAEIKKM